MPDEDRPKRKMRRQCTARSKTTGEQCGNPPVKDPPGIDKCRFHGGAAPQVKAKALREQTERKAAAALDRMQIVPVEDPLTELKQLAGQVLAWKDLLASLVDNLNEKYRYGTEYNEAVRGEVQLFERALDRCTTVLSVIAKLNIDERLAAVTERQAQMLQDALFASYDEAGLTITDADQKDRIARAFSRHLSVVAEGA